MQLTLLCSLYYSAQSLHAGGQNNKTQTQHDEVKSTYEDLWSAKEGKQSNKLHYQLAHQTRTDVGGKYRSKAIYSKTLLMDHFIKWITSHRMAWNAHLQLLNRWTSSTWNLLVHFKIHLLKMFFVILRPSFSASDWPSYRLTFSNVTRWMLHGKEFVWGSNSRTPTLGIELSIAQLWSICVNH